ncbi:hypothetical protein QU487_06320 [Crenobacter sp. SG2305]|uniref:hypothetical protein n=1 Tax=Crenobacter oryzisoli TaxID=3056844 RepID=UPI0025AA6B5C|nr:hypothetical protein [Crenobacter sp. SG2305]MDN0082367.1 hypothetical protein [Crenobacter sp. SG2305]
MAYFRALSQDQAQEETGGHVPAYSSTECGIAVIARPIRHGEPDLLIGRENEALSVKGPTGDVVYSVSPSAPWTHDSIVQALSHADVVRAVNGDVADAYLGDVWIGSTEL